jgi:N-acetylglucosaminyl-diphospho-decaprenol L-rhamnosyltransferase
MNGSDVDIVILNWKTAAMSGECAHAAAAALPGAQIYLVDNGSDDGSPEHLRRAVPAATVVETGANLGFGGGMNAGIRAGRRPYVLLLNSDARPVDDGLSMLLDCLAADPQLGAVGPMTVDAALEPTPQLPAEPPAWKLVVSSIPFVWRITTAEPFVPAGGPPARIGWLPTLCAAGFRRAALEAIGGFDPGYFLGWEEWDITRRLHDAGWAIAIHPSAAVLHHGRGSTPSSLTAWRNRHSRRAICYHLRKYHGPIWYTLGRATCALREAYQGLKTGNTETAR